MRTSHATRVYCNGCRQYFATLPDYDLHDCAVFSSEPEADQNPAYPSYRELLRRAARRDPIYAPYASCPADDPLGIQQTIDYFRSHHTRALAR